MAICNKHPRYSGINIKQVNKAKSISHILLLLCNCSIDNQMMIDANITPSKRPFAPATEPERENHKTPSGSKKEQLES